MSAAAVRETLSPIDDPDVRARLAEMYMKESRDHRRFGWRPSDTAEGRLMHVAANWENVRNRLGFVVALSLVRTDGSIGTYCSFAREFAASIIVADRAMDRWRAAWKASKEVTR